MEIISKRCHCALWAKLICQISEGCAPEGLNHLSNISGEVSPQSSGQDGEWREWSVLALTQVLTWPVSVKSPGVAVSWRDSNAALTCRACSLPWKQRLEGRPRGPVIGAGVTFEIWKQLTVAASASSRENVGAGVRAHSGHGAHGKAASLAIFWIVECESQNIFSALSFLVSCLVSTPAKWNGCFLKAQVLFFFPLQPFLSCHLNPRFPPLHLAAAP